MADPRRRHPQNVPGPWFVDDRCIACDTCTDISPEIFGRDEARKAYVHAREGQDSALFRAALESCPVEAVGDEMDPSSLTTA
ncbi:MAG TPA: ferredoxin [Myxococcota bacterium]|nr:ferredoxin [Myxococcota bacterium]